MSNLAVDDYLTQIQEYNSFITYDVYCNAISLAFENMLTEDYFFEYLEEGILDNIRKMRLSRELLKVFRDLKSGLEKIGRDFKLNLNDLFQSIKNREVYNVLRSFGFNFKLIYRSINELTKFLRGGLLEIFREMTRHKTFQKIRSGVIKVDQVLDKYPLLKKITGIAVAGILLYIWFNMTFIGDLDYDFNFTDTIAALSGTFSLTNLFMSPEGLMLLTLFGSGFAFGLSFPWLGKSAYNLIVAIVYTGYAKIKGDKKKLNMMKRKMKRGVNK